MINFSNAYSKNTGIREAAASRVQADYSKILTSDELNKLVDSFINSTMSEKESTLLGYANPVLLSKDLLLSQSSRSQWKDKAFFIEVLARGVNDLKTKIQQSSMVYNDVLEVTAQSLAGILSTVYGDFGARVNYGLSQGIGYHFVGLHPSYFDLDYNHIQDPRTGRKFLQNEYLDFDTVNQASLPILESNVADIASIHIDPIVTGTIGFESHVEYSDPRDMLASDRSFHAKFFLGEASSNSESLSKRPLMTVVVQLSSAQLINRLSYKHAVSGVFLPLSFEYWDGTDWVDWPVLVSGQAGLYMEKFILRNAITDKIRIIFTSFLDGDAGVITRNDTPEVQFNQLLSEAKWSTLFQEHANDFAGLVFDWYINQLQFSYVSTRARGYCVSNPIVFDGRLQKLMSITRAGDFEYDTEDNEFFPFKKVHEGSLEGYALITAYSDDGLEAVNEIIPMPSVPVESIGRNFEWLPLLGNVGRLRFFPLLNINESKLQANDTVSHTVILPKVWSTARGVLDVGTDYLVSVDNGVTWLSSWPSSDYYGKVVYAGDAAIKLISRTAGENFIVSYVLAGNQWLSRTKNFKLQGTKVFTSSDLKKKYLSYELRQLVVLRQPSKEEGMGPVSIGMLFLGEKHAS